ncbi:hypothetical protein TVAG_329490 [Trichomonas vaginalis G3]|uniref:Uncharacterized protein n=1 Tax=Trichomonas vaginalis (strain ATCC PRA-98 / G3) TaxID=412133 RepID=A2EBB7_TRIV3|nr:protein ubiquitination [Trichomonas vaginalis G3]EAY10062.1 hypothetical protein TVAG_329490 [Trichomonas vaginalis G3]KAI5528488.1 protein ubiquitination [Trichomonas vaginalis G3]|eukprot:XP_001322285.1 hypothetical protein [Trichomonas vaginalis G3]
MENLEISCHLLIDLIDTKIVPANHILRVISYAGMKRRKKVQVFLKAFDIISSKIDNKFYYDIMNKQFMRIRNFDDQSKSHYFENLENNYISNIIAFDDLHKLQEITSSSNFDWPKINDMLDIATKWNSINCYHFLVLNSTDFIPDIFLSVIGGSFELIKAAFTKRNSISKKDYKEAFKLAVEYNRNDVAEWILSIYRLSFKNVTAYSSLYNFCNTEICLLMNKLGRINAKHENTIRKPFEEFSNYFSLINEKELFEKSMNLLNIDISHEDKLIEVEEVKKVINQKEKIVAREKILHFLEENFQFKEIQDFTPVISSSIHQNFDILKIAVERGCSVNTTFCLPQNKFCYSPLSFAIKMKNKEIAKYLVEKGANVTFIQTEAKYYRYPYRSDETEIIRNYDLCSYAIKNGLYEVALEILHKNSPIYKDSKAPNVLMYACKYGHFDIVKELLEKGMNVNERVEKHPHVFISPLMMCCKRGNLEIAKYLVEKGANCNDMCSTKKRFLYYTPLSLSVQSKNLDLVKYLINNGADYKVMIQKKKSPNVDTVSILNIAESIQDNSDMIDYLKSIIGE